MRLTLNQISTTNIPQALGCCANDLATLAANLNEAIQSLINAGGETGWSYFGWRRVVFNVDKDNPYIICPREIVRLVNADVRRSPARIHNEWFEFLEGGPGLQSACNCTTSTCFCGTVGMFDRGFFPPMDISAGNYIRVYLTDARDVGKRILFSQALDSNGVRIYTQDGVNNVDGFYLTLEDSFITSAFEVTGFNAISKDPMFGEIIIKQVDSTTGVEVTISRVQPDELTPTYRKYLVSQLPAPCSGQTTVQITALAKLEFIPLVRGTDFLPFSNLMALRLAIESLKLSKSENPALVQMAEVKRKQAIRELQNEQRHVYGEQKPSITQTLSGLEGLRAWGIGRMT